jgi:hypothetical protein
MKPYEFGRRFEEFSLCRKGGVGAKMPVLAKPL